MPASVPYFGRALILIECLSATDNEWHGCSIAVSLVSRSAASSACAGLGACVGLVWA